MAQYRVLTGIDYPPNKRAEVGQIVSDLPPQSVKWLLESGAIEDASKPAKQVEESVVEAPKAEPVEEEAQETTPTEDSVEEK